MMAEENTDTFNCHCGRQFKRASAFRRHQEVAHSTCASHKCTECGKTFGNANTLTMHMSVHEKKEQASFTRLVGRPSRATRSTRATLRVLQEEASSTNESPTSSTSAGPGVGAAPVQQQGTTTTTTSSGSASAAANGSNQQSGASQQQQNNCNNSVTPSKEIAISDQAPRSARAKRQQLRGIKQENSNNCTSSSSHSTANTSPNISSVLLQSDCVRQTRAGALKAEATNCSTSSSSSATPAAAGQQQRQPELPSSSSSSGAGSTTRATRTATAAAAQAAASLAAAAASPASSSPRAESLAAAAKPGLVGGGGGVSGTSTTSAAGQKQHQPPLTQQQEGAGSGSSSSSSRSYHDEVCNDAAGSSVRPELLPRGGHVAVAAVPSKQGIVAVTVDLGSSRSSSGIGSSSQPTQVEAEEEKQPTTTGAVIGCAGAPRLPAGREESKPQAGYAPPDGHLTELSKENAQRGCDDARCTPTISTVIAANSSKGQLQQPTIAHPCHDKTAAALVVEQSESATGRVVNNVVSTVGISHPSDGATTAKSSTTLLPAAAATARVRGAANTVNCGDSSSDSAHSSHQQLSENTQSTPASPAVSSHLSLSSSSLVVTTTTAPPPVYNSDTPAPITTTNTLLQQQQCISARALFDSTTGLSDSSNTAVVAALNHPPHLNGCLPPQRHTLSAADTAAAVVVAPPGLQQQGLKAAPAVVEGADDTTQWLRGTGGVDEDEDDCVATADPQHNNTKQPALRKSSRDRKENPIWKTLLTGRMYEEVLSSVGTGRGGTGAAAGGHNTGSAAFTGGGGPPSKRARRVESTTATVEVQQQQHPNTSQLPNLQSQPNCGYNLTMIPTTVVKQEPMEYAGFNPDHISIKQELVEMEPGDIQQLVESGQALPDIVSSLQGYNHSRLKRGPVRRTRSGSMSGNSQVARNSPTATFDCLVCGKTFISEKYLSMHISLHETSKTEPGTGVGQGEDTLCPGQINTNVNNSLADGEILKPPQQVAPPEMPMPTLPTIVEQISCTPVSNNNHLNSTPTTKSNNTGGGNSNSNKKSASGGSNSTRKASKLQTDGGWSCSLCNKTFAHNSGYKNHMRTHSNERPYVCHICDIGFKEKYHLKKHNLFIHSNELPEKCRVCGKRFKDSTAVRAHERIHSDERPFACRQCSKTFKTSECLWHHEHRSKTCGMALGEIIAQERLIRRRRRFPKSGAGNNGNNGNGNNQTGNHGVQQQPSPQSPASGSDTNPDSSPLMAEHEANNDLYKWHAPHQQQQAPPPHPHMTQSHPHHHQHQAPPHHHQLHQVAPLAPAAPHQELVNDHLTPQHLQSAHQKLNSIDQYIPPVTTYFPTTTTNSLPTKENVHHQGVATSNAVNKHSLIASQLQSCVQPLHPEVTSALQATPLPPPPNQPQVPLCVEQHNMSSPPPPGGDDDGRLSPTNLAMTMTMKDLNCLNEIPHGMHPHEDEMLVAAAHSMYPLTTVNTGGVPDHHGGVKQERDAFGYSMDEDEENWVTTNMDKIMDKESDDLIDSKVDAILSNMASSMSSAFGMLAGDPLPPSPPMADFTDNKEYRCRVCRKTFSDLIAFQRHSKVHSDERPFVCLKCDIGFKMKVHLKKHNLYVHSNEYPCECQHCGKKFKDSSAVKLHERTHSDTRPFGCTGCGKAFKTRENLWGHQHRGKCIAGRKKAEQEANGSFDDQMPSAKASVLNNGISAHATVNTNGVTAQACVNNSQVTAHASIENNQITAHATFANQQFTAHASVVNNQVTAHATISTTVSTTPSDVVRNGTFTTQAHNTSMTDTKTMAGSIPSTTQYGGSNPTIIKSFIAQSLMTPPLNSNKATGGTTSTMEGATLSTGQPQQPTHQPQNASPTAGTLPVTCSTALPPADAGTGTVQSPTTTSPTTLVVQKQKDDSGAAGKWPTLKEFLSKGIGPPTPVPVPTWTGMPQQAKGNSGQTANNNNNNNSTNNNNNNNNNNSGEYKQLANDYPALKERLSRNFFSQLPTVVTVAPPPPASSSSANNTSYPSSPASSNLSAPYSGQTTPTAGTSPYGKGRDSVSPYSDYSPSHSSAGAIPSFQSTFLNKRTHPPPLFGNNPMLRGDDPNIPIIYWDDDGDQRPPSSVWTSPESDSMFQDISESVFTQL